MRNFVVHPDTGQPAEEVVSYQAVELSQLQARVDETAADLEAKTQAVENLKTQLQEAETTQAAAEVAHEDSKSDVERYQSVATGTGADTEAEGAGVEDPTGDQSESESQPVDVRVETPDPAAAVDEPVADNF